MLYYNTNFEKTLGMDINGIIMSKDEVDRIFDSLEDFKAAKNGKTNGNLYLKFLAVNEYVTKILKDGYEKGKKYDKDFLDHVNYFCEKMIEHSDNEYCLLNLDFGLSPEYMKKFYGKDYQFLDNKRIEKINEFNDLKEKYFNNKVLSVEEYDTLMNTYQTLLDKNQLSEESVEKLIDRMVNKRKISAIEKRLFYSLLAYQDINKRKLETAFAVSDYNTEDKIFNDRNIGVSELNKILINFNSVKYRNQSDIAKTVYHEIVHREQYEKSLSSDLDYSSFEYIKIYLFNIYPEITNADDYYHKNYFSKLKQHMKMSRIEIEADQIGHLKVAELLDKYCTMENRDNWIENQIEKSKKVAFIDNIGLRSNDIQSGLLVEKMEIPAIVKIIKEHPEELNNFPGLRKIFDSDGRIKSMVSLVTQIAEENGMIISSKTKSPYFDFIKYGISSDMFNKIDINNLSKDEQFDFFRGLDTFVVVETKKIKELMRTEDEELLKDSGFRKNLVEEVRRMKKLEKFVNDAKSKENYAQGASLHVQDEIKYLKEFYNEKFPELKEKKEKVFAFEKVVDKQTSVDSNKQIFVNYLLDAYDSIESEFLSEKRQQDENFNEDRVKNIIDTNGLNKMLLSDLIDTRIIKDENGIDKIEYSQKQVSAIVRLLKAAQNISSSEGINYLEKFMNVPVINDILKDLYNDSITDKDSYMFYLKEEYKNIKNSMSDSNDIKRR